MSSSTAEQQQQQQTLYQNVSPVAEIPALNQQGSLQNSLSQISIQEGWASGVNPGFASKDNSATNNSLSQGEWLHPASAQLIGYHDCRSLAYAWGLGTSTSSLDGRPTGASQAQSPSEDDLGDGKNNELLASCPAFRNELGNEPIRSVALSRNICQQQFITHDQVQVEESLQTWHREHIAAEIGVLEDVSNVYLGGKLCAERQPKIVVEPQDMGSYYYRHCFVGRSHLEYCGTDESLGPCVISMVREETKDGSIQHTIYRLILRISDVLTMRVAVPEEALSDSSQDRSTRNLMRELLETVCPQLHFGTLRPAINMQKVEEMLLKIDEQPIYTRYKVGILYCKAGQSTEEQMYNNEHSSPHFEEFLDFLGTRVRLKGFDSYKGGLDTRGDTTGLHSIYAEHHSAQIMFHVSTMLPFTPNNKQQLARKRHIGNDMVTIIFQEPDALPFSPITVRSHFQHVFIVVRVCNPLTENVSYKVAVSRAKDVPPFGPPLLPSATYQKSAEFHDFLIHKIINAENAVHRSRKFASMAARTRREALKDLVENYAATHHTNEGASRIASRLLGGSMKRRERVIPKPVLDTCLRAAISWQVEVFDHSLNQRAPAVLGLSADNLVLLDVPSGLSIFATPTHSILGWIQIPDGGIKIFYDHGDMLLLWCISPDGSEREIGFLLKRLFAVTNGDEAKEVILRKTKSTESFGFSIQEEGIVTEVDMNKSAWRVGLRQGSRVVEFENNALIMHNLEQIAELLIERMQLKVTMISPSSDGNPRRGCEDSTCPAIRGQECQPVLTPDTFARQPLAYQKMFNALRNQPETQQPQGQQEKPQRRPLPPRISASSDSWSGPPPTGHSLSAVPERKKHSAPAFSSHGERQNRPPAKSSVDSSVQHTGIFNRATAQQHFSSEDGQCSKDQQQQSPSTFGRTCSDDVTTMTSTINQLSMDITPPQLQLRQGPSLEDTLLFHSLTTQAASSTSLHLQKVQEVNLGTEEQQNANKRRISADGELTKCQWWLQKTMEEKKELEIELNNLKAQLATEQRAHENTRKHLQIMTEYCERFSIIPPPFEEGDEEL